MSLVLTLASRNLFHDRVRFVATTIGIVFSVVLVMVQLGLYFGFGQMVTTMIDHASADLWVISKGTKSFEDLTMLDSALDGRIKAVNGVAEAVPAVIGFAEWRLPDGATTPIFIVGSDLRTGALVPWDLVQGSVAALNAPGAVSIDKYYLNRLGVTGVGAKAEIRGQPVRVAAVSNGIRSFTTTPYVFAGLSSARSYIGLPAEKTSDFLVRLKPGAKAEQVARAINVAIPGVQALTPAQFDAKSRSFWLNGTGAGAALFGGALLGVIVGIVIVAQTLYSSTKDHLPEFATLRAIGCSRSYIFKVIIDQAVLSAVIGYAIAVAIGFAVVYVTASTALPIVIPAGLAAGLFGLTAAMCIASAVISIVRVLHLDPATVLAR